jgi:uncharacterized protein
MERMSFGLREFKFAQDGDAMTLSGYGAVFGNVDAYGDMIEPGAFGKTLAAHKSAGTMPMMLLEHGAGPLPVGVWTGMSEDGIGLKVDGKLLDTTDGLDTYKALKAGAVSGLSIGYRPVEFEMRSKPEDPRRRLKSVELIEVSIVGMPANGRARVSSVKSADEIMTIRDLEYALRDAGLSKSEAVKVASRFQAKADRGDLGADEAAIAAARRLLQSIQTTR